MVAFCAGAVVCSFPFVSLAGQSAGHPDRGTDVLLGLVSVSAILGGAAACALARKPIAHLVLQLPLGQKSPSLFVPTVIASFLALVAATTAARWQVARLFSTVTDKKADARLRIAGLEEMGREGDHHLPTLRRIAVDQSEPVNVRLTAIRYLKHGESEPSIRVLARDPSPEIRGLALRHLYWENDRALIEELASDPSIEVKRQAARHISGIRSAATNRASWTKPAPPDPGLTRALERLLHSTDPTVVLIAADALRYERKQEAFEAVLPLVTEWDRGEPVSVLCRIDWKRTNQEIGRLAQGFSVCPQTFDPTERR